MSLSVITLKEFKKLPSEYRRDSFATDEGVFTRGDALQAWLDRHELRRGGAATRSSCLCQLGKGANAADCRRTPYGHPCQRPSPTFDHQEVFYQYGKRTVIISEPYGFDLEHILPICNRWNVAVVQHPKAQSFHYPGGCHLLAFMSPEYAPYYLSLEPEAGLLYQPNERTAALAAE